MNDRCDVVTDASEALPAFCQSLEAILRQGLKSKLIFVSLTWSENSFSAVIIWIPYICSGRKTKSY